MTITNPSDYKDVFYHCIPILDTRTPKHFNAKIRCYASELFDELPAHLRSLLSNNSLTKENWIRRAQRMVIHPDFDRKEKTTYISLRKSGKCSDSHEEVLDLLAARLLSKAPKNYPVQKTVVSSETTDYSKPSPWFIYKDGHLSKIDDPEECWS